MFVIIATMLLVIAAFMAAFAAWKSSQIAKRIEIYNKQMNKPNISIIEKKVIRIESNKQSLQFLFTLKNVGRETCDIMNIIVKFYDLKNRFPNEIIIKPILRLKFESTASHHIPYDLLKNITEYDLKIDGLIILYTIIYSYISQNQSIRETESFVYKYNGGDSLYSFTREDYTANWGIIHESFRKELEECFGLEKA